MFAFMRQQEPPMLSEKDALPGRSTPIKVTEPHFVNGHQLTPPYSDEFEKAMFGMGCFWGAERLFWKLSGVYVTAVGYAAGYTPNPTYEEVCSGMTGHNEVVLVVYDQNVLRYAELLKTFWEGHDPSQGMRQGNDLGTQYRSGIYCYSAKDKREAKVSQTSYEKKLRVAGHRPITTEILDAPEFFFAETYHQQYLGRNPNGYCGLGGTGVGFK